jgi:hypothetical protein
MIAWFFCALFTVLSIKSPHCDLCDGLPFLQKPAAPMSVHHHTPTQPEQCNEVCSCCGLIAVVVPPIALPVASLLSSAQATPPAQRTPRWLHRDFFRPPRLTLTSWLVLPAL